MDREMENKLLNAGKENETAKGTDVESLKEKYSGTDEKIYTVITTVQVDDETEEEFTFLFRKPKPASYDRYVKTISNSVTKASKSFAYRDSIIHVLSAKIDNYRKTDILKPSEDMLLEQDTVIMAGDINVSVRNVAQSSREKE